MNNLNELQTIYKLYTNVLHVYLWYKKIALVLQEFFAKGTFCKLMKNLKSQLQTVYKLKLVNFKSCES